MVVHDQNMQDSSDLSNINLLQSPIYKQKKPHKKHQKSVHLHKRSCGKWDFFFVSLCRYFSTTSSHCDCHLWMDQPICVNVFVVGYNVAPDTHHTNTAKMQLQQQLSQQQQELLQQLQLLQHQYLIHHGINLHQQFMGSKQKSYPLNGGKLFSRRIFSGHRYLQLWITMRIDFSFLPWPSVQIYFKWTMRWA